MCINRLMETGISHSDATALRRIAMTLHRWHELECGDANGHCVVRGKKNGVEFTYDDDGDAYLECAGETGRNRYWRIPDRERGAKKRLAKIMARYTQLTSYIQTDPRGAALYILRPDDVPTNADVDAYYNRGIAVYK